MAPQWSDSTAKIKLELASSLDTALKQLKRIWDEIGFDHDQCQERIDTMVVHVSSLLEAMVNDEQSLKTRLLADVEKYGQDLIRISKELNVPAPEPQEGLSILELEKDLRTKFEKLSREKQERMKILKRLRTSDQQLCDTLCSTPYYIPTGTVPSRKDLEDLEKHVKLLQDEKAQRLAKFQKTRKDIIHLMEETEQAGDTSLQADILNEEDEVSFLTSENMRAVAALHKKLEEEHRDNVAALNKLKDRAEQLWERLQVPEDERQAFREAHSRPSSNNIQLFREEIKRCEKLKRDNMGTVIQKTKEELVHWWDKCYYSQEQRAQFTYFDDEGLTEESLELLDAEVEKVRAFYNEHMSVLSKIAKRQELFLEFLEFERKAADPNRFFNRKCNLLQEEKARKKLMKELPRLEEEVKEELATWESQNGKDFLIQGLKFPDYVKKQWEDYKNQKEAEKSQRHQAKAKQMAEEVKFGSKPVTMTPTKRRLGNNTQTPSKTPNKIRKLGEPVTPGVTPRTPGTGTKLATTPRPNPTSIFSSPAFGSRTKISPKKKIATTTGARKQILKDKNTNENELFSHTAISSQTIASCDNDTIATIANYTEFATDINHAERENCQSSMMRF